MFVSGKSTGSLSGESGAKALLDGVERLLKKHDAQNIQQRFSGLEQTFASAGVMLHEIRQRSEVRNAADMERIIDDQVPNNIGVKPLGKIAEFLKQMACQVENEKEAKLLLNMTTFYCSLRTKRLLLLMQKIVFLSSLGTEETSAAAEGLGGYINKFELGKKRWRDLLFLIRPLSADNTLVAELYRSKDWSVTEQYITAIGLKRPQPLTGFDLEVQGWKDVTFFSNEGECVKGHSKLYARSGLPGVSDEDLPFPWSGRMTCDALPFEDTEFFRLRFRNVYSGETAYASLGTKSKPRKRLRATSEEEEAVLVRFIFTEDNVCLLAPHDTLGIYFTAYQDQPVHRWLNIRLQQSKPGRSGHWRMQFTDEHDRQFTASEYDKKSKVMFFEDPRDKITLFCRVMFLRNPSIDLQKMIDEEKKATRETPLQEEDEVPAAQAKTWFFSSFSSKKALQTSWQRENEDFPTPMPRRRGRKAVARAMTYFQGGKDAAKQEIPLQLEDEVTRL